MRNIVLEEVFERLDCWRGLPNYQLERRIDILFAHYLKVIVENHLLNQGQEVTLHNTIIPEFPVRNSLVGGGNTNHSFKVDYVLFSQEPGLIFFLELKTDMASIDKCQKAKLKMVLRLAFGDILCDLKKIFVTGNKLKYLYLFECL